MEYQPPLAWGDTGRVGHKEVEEFSGGKVWGNRGKEVYIEGRREGRRKRRRERGREGEENRGKEVLREGGRDGEREEDQGREGVGK